MPTRASIWPLMPHEDILAPFEPKEPNSYYGSRTSMYSAMRKTLWKLQSDNICTICTRFLYTAVTIGSSTQNMATKGFTVRFDDEDYARLQKWQTMEARRSVADLITSIVLKLMRGESVTAPPEILTSGDEAITATTQLFLGELARLSEEEVAGLANQLDIAPDTLLELRRRRHESPS